MSSAYRESDNTPPAPLEELRWRKHVARSARYAVAFMATDTALLLTTPLVPGRFAMAEAVAWFAVGLGAALAAWMLTAGRPGRRVHWGGWLLRGSLAAHLVILGLLLLGGHLVVASYISGAVLAVAAVSFAVACTKSLASPPRPRPRRGLVGAFTLVVWGVLEVLESWVGTWRSIGVGVLAAATYLLLGLEHTLRVDRHHWWFDTEMEPPGEWVALLVHRDKHTEVLCVDQTLGWFDSGNEAAQWLEDNGYVPAERALAEHLVESVPPDVLPLARRRRRLRIELNEPRVRVVPDTSDHEAPEPRDGAVDELEDAGLPDEAPPRRATAIHERHDRD